MRAWRDTLISVVVCYLVSLWWAKATGKDPIEWANEFTTAYVALVALLTANKAYYREPRE